MFAKMAEFTVYGLIDPRDGVLRYVGKSGDVVARVGNHRSTATNPKSSESATVKGKWIRELLEGGVEPRVVALYELESYAVAMRIERMLHWIHRKTLFNGSLPAHDMLGDHVASRAVALAAIDYLRHAGEMVRDIRRVANSEEVENRLIEMADYLFGVADGLSGELAKKPLVP